MFAPLTVTYTPVPGLILYLFYEDYIQQEATSSNKFVVR